MRHCQHGLPAADRIVAWYGARKWMTRGSSHVENRRAERSAGMSREEPHACAQGQARAMTPAIMYSAPAEEALPRVQWRDSRRCSVAESAP